MVAQTVALLTSIKVGNKPDTPSPTGTVNRVVKGVTIYDYNTTFGGGTMLTLTAKKRQWIVCQPKKESLAH